MRAEVSCEPPRPRYVVKAKSQFKSRSTANNVAFAGPGILFFWPSASLLGHRPRNPALGSRSSVLLKSKCRNAVNVVRTVRLKNRATQAKRGGLDYQKRKTKGIPELENSKAHIVVIDVIVDLCFLFVTDTVFYQKLLSNC